MALILKKSYKSYYYLTYDLADPEYINDWTTSPLFLVGFIAGYLFIVNRLGPKLMENKKPYNIRNIIIVYNVLQILINAKLTYEAVYVIKSSPNKICVESLYKDLISTIRHQFFALKMLDCVETVFFVLRKSYRQVSFLHVYHHSGMILSGWIGTKYDAGDMVVWIAALNCFIHFIMFVYYLLTSIDTAWKKSMFLKKTLTTLQLIQFLMFIFIYTVSSLIPDCSKFPRFLAFLFVAQNMFMFCLFSEFYYRTYWKKEKIKK